MIRNLKVYYYRTTSKSRCYCTKSDTYNPQIMLTGKWLRELGFEIGNSITLNCEHGKIMIQNNTDIMTGDKNNA